MKKWILLASLTASSIATAMPYIPMPAAPSNNLFLLVGAGESWSRTADIFASPIIWDPAIQGYNDKVGKTVLYTGGVGYQFPCGLSADFELSYRPNYSYSRYQIPSATGTPGFLGTKTRKFRLDSTSIMFNMALNGAAYNWYANYDGIILSPFIGAGLGVSYNTLWNFHSVTPIQATPGFNNVGSVENYKRRGSFAWQAFIGAEVAFCHNWAVDLGYRYFNGGKFKSNDYVTTLRSGGVSPGQTIPWTGKLKANEFFLNLKYNLA